MISLHYSEAEDSGFMMNRLRSEIATASWTTAPRDYSLKYFGSQVTSRAMTVMPPAVGVDSITIQARMETDPTTTKVQPRWKASFELNPTLKAVLKDLPPEVVSHRSRPITLSFRRGVPYELQRRMILVKENQQLIRDNAIPPDLMRQIMEVKAEAALKAMETNVEHLRKYITEHKDSSVLPGNKWPTLGDPANHLKTWQDIEQLHRANFEKIINGELIDKHFEPMFNGGARARYNGDPVVAGIEEMEGSIERTRMVAFHPVHSTGFAFIPKEKKPQFYRDCIEGAIELFPEWDVDAHLMCPLYDGGKVYPAMHDALLGGSPTLAILGDDTNMVNADGEFSARDGKGWESQAGSMMGTANGYDRLQIGHQSIASGVMFTSIDGTIASAWLARNGPRDVAGIMETEQADQDRKFFLGLSLEGITNPEGDPHLIGAKLMADNAAQFKPLPENQVLKLKRQNEEAEMYAHQAAFYGKTPDNGRLIDLFGAVEAGDWVNPGRLVNEVIGLV